MFQKDPLLCHGWRWDCCYGMFSLSYFVWRLCMCGFTECTMQCEGPEHPYNSGSARVQVTLYRATCTADITSQDIVCRLKPSSMLHGSVFCIQPCAAVGLHRVNYFNSWLSRLTTPALFNLTPSETPSFSLSPSPLYMPGSCVRVARRQPNDMMHLQGPTARYRY